MINSQQAAIPDSTAQDAAQHIATPFIARQDAIADHHSNSPDMIGNDFHRHLLVRLGIISATDSDDFFNDRENQIRFKIRFFLLDNRSRPFQPTACINIFLGQWFIFSIFRTVVLSEYEIPYFQIPVTVTSYRTGRFATAPFRSQVIEYFTIRATGAFADFPEIIVKFKNTFIGQTNHIVPVIIGFFVIRINSDIQLIRIQFNDLRQKFPCPGNSFFFKIIAKGEITQHFKKRMMAGCPAYIVNVVSPDTFLARRNAIRRRYEFSSKIRFQRSHTSTDKQQARVVFRNQGKTVQNQMLFTFEKFQIGFTDFISRHILHNFKHSLSLSFWYDSDYTLFSSRWATFLP